MTRQEIAEAFFLSTSTALQNAAGLIKAGILEGCSSVQTAGSRKAKKLRLRQEAGLVIDIHIGIYHVRSVTANLSGTLWQTDFCQLAFQNKLEWYTQFREALLNFLKTHRFLKAAYPSPALLIMESLRFSAPTSWVWSTWAWSGFGRSYHSPRRVCQWHQLRLFLGAGYHAGRYIYLSERNRRGRHYGPSLTWSIFQAGKIGHMLLISERRECCCGK